MSHSKRSFLIGRVVLPLATLGVAGLAALGGLTATAAAASPTTPPSTVTCAGTITPDAGGSAAGNANPFDYQFSCSPTSLGATAPSPYTWQFDGNIWSYAIVVTRRNNDGANVTYNAPTANVLNFTTGAVDPSQYVNCTSFVPSDGFTCTDPGPNGSSASALSGGYKASIPAGEDVTGAFALSEPYCSYLPKGAKPGTPAVPRATVELIVTDDNGVTEGPFELARTGKCPKVAAVVPQPKAKAKTSAKKAKVTTKQSASRAAVRSGR